MYSVLKLIYVVTSATIIIDSDDSELPSGILSIHETASSPPTESDEELLKAITTKVSVFKGRHMQGPAKQFNADLTLSFHVFTKKMLEIAKKKIGNQANMLVVEDLILAYNWGPAKDPAKRPLLLALKMRKIM